MIVWALKGGLLCRRESRAFAVPPRFLTICISCITVFDGSCGFPWIGRQESCNGLGTIILHTLGCYVYTTFPPCDVTEMNFWLTFALLDFQANAEICGWFHGGFNWIRRINTYPFVNVTRNHACYPVFQAGNQHEVSNINQREPSNINQLLISTN